MDHKTESSKCSCLSYCCECFDYYNIRDHYNDIHILKKYNRVYDRYAHFLAFKLGSDEALEYWNSLAKTLNIKVNFYYKKSGNS